MNESERYVFCSSPPPTTRGTYTGSSTPTVRMFANVTPLHCAGQRNSNEKSVNGWQFTPFIPQSFKASQYVEVHPMNESAGVRKKLARAMKAKEIIYPTMKIQKNGARCNRRVYLITFDSSRRVNGRPRTLYVLSSQGARAEKLVRWVYLNGNKGRTR
jgi:hypothetical protein